MFSLSMNRYKPFWLLAIILQFSLLCQAQTTNGNRKSTKIQFTTLKWDAVKKLAKQQGKLIFVDAYAEWCAPCKLMVSTIFTDKTVSSYFNTKFINVKIDMEKEEGVHLAELWNVSTYPTLLFLDSSGKIVSFTEGYIDASGLLKLGKQIDHPKK